MNRDRLMCFLYDLRKNARECAELMILMYQTTEPALRQLDDGGEAWNHHAEIVMELEALAREQRIAIENFAEENRE